MSEFWKSLPRKFCDICKCWFADNKASIEFHERGKRHQENAQKRIQDIQKRGIKEFKKQKQLEDDMAKIEKAALAAYKKDLQNNLEVVSNPLSNAINNSITENNSKVSENDHISIQPLKTNKATKAKKKKSSEIPVNLEVKKEESLEILNNATIKQEVVSDTRKWHESMSDEGYKYYWNTETSESQWEPPEEGYVSLEEQQQPHSEANTENVTCKIKKEREEEDTNNNEKTPISNFGPQPKVDPYGKWVTVKHEQPEEIDLQLPKPSEDIIEVVIPVAQDEPKLKFKEKVIGQLKDSDPSEKVTFKKRKFASSAKQNTRRRLDDD